MKGIFDYFAKRSQIPVENRNYSPIYLVLTGILFIGTIWSVYNEVDTRRPWKDIQENFLKLSEKKWQDKYQEAKSAVDSATFAQLQAQLNEANAKMQSPEYKQIQDKVNEIQEKLIDANRDFTFAKSKSDETYYFWKKSVHEGQEDQGLKKKVQEYADKLLVFGAKVDQLTAQQDSLQKLEDSYKMAVKEAKIKLNELTAAMTLATTKLDKIHSSSIVIKQVMLNDFDRSNFGIPKARIDRCQTCHLGWKDDLMEDAAQPFTKHPVQELLKVHNPETFGCTPCHHGQGPALTAGGAHGNEDKYWEWPLLRGKEVYASCVSCHSNQSYLANGDQYNKARMILSEAGCFGCHDIKGFNDLDKIGPDVSQEAAKAKPDWILRWIRNPKDYNPHTRMPNFKFSDDQSKAITAYFVKITNENPYPVKKGISDGGNAAHGKDLVNNIGCKGCHVIGDDTRMRQARGFSYDIAPELTRAGSKLDPDWMYQWIKNPRMYRPKTRMPDLRLSDQEAKDIVAYLKTLTDDRQLDRQNLSDIDSPDLAKKGEKLIREYGCAGCHTIKGMEKESKVSVSLSNIGKKRIDEIDFGDTKVPHNWDDWIFGKMKDSRQYATDRIVSKMPVFSLADSEIVVLRTLLRGFTKETPEEKYRQPFDKRLQAVESGRKLTHYYNCINCHQVEEYGGYVKATLDDEAFAPPYLYPEGSKVQEEWLANFLKGPTPIRPWLKLRMPTFHLNDLEITTVSKYFLGLHNMDLELRDYKEFQVDQTFLAPGNKLFDEFQCLSCHYTGKIPEGKSLSDLAPNLAMAKGRLKPEWILDWIAKPDSIQPGTRMPGFYPDMQSPDADILGGNSLQQIRALRDHVFTIGGGTKKP
jgi:mono/diheme cytochrome c family protein